KNNNLTIMDRPKNIPTRKTKREHAEAFGGKRGWHLSDAPFTARTLARNGVHDGKRTGFRDGLTHRYKDHAYYYRDRRHAKAIVAHLYHIPDDIYEVARELGLHVEVRP